MAVMQQASAEKRKVVKGHTRKRKHAEHAQPAVNPAGCFAAAV